LYSSRVEEQFIGNNGFESQNSKIPYLIVDSFPDLGLLTALRFFEWVFNNPEGVISLPTGKTPEYFIKWTSYLLSNWNSSKVKSIRKKYNLSSKTKPDFSKLHFIQIDEFYPLNPNQHNSFYNYVNKYYLASFGIKKSRALLINTEQIPLASNMHWMEVFPQGIVDLTLRHREANSDEEKYQQESLYLIDQWCNMYEKKIQELGGIGFFLGGIGPDGHIAFNVRGSDHNSTTRLTQTNFETQAAAAVDLGGIEISRNRLVITIGLGTITYNKNATTIIIAAGEAKAPIVQKSIESEQNIMYPASSLQKLANSRFYITEGAAKKLKDVKNSYWKESPWDIRKKQKALLILSKDKQTFGKKLTVDDFKKEKLFKSCQNLNKNTISKIIDSIDKKVQRGIKSERNQIYYHTGPHHDDIMLGMMPHIIHLVREPTNKHIFTNMTSGFTSVTNSFLIKIIKKTIDFIQRDRVRMINYPDFFSNGYKLKRDKDVYHYLDRIADNDVNGQQRGLCHRVIRSYVEIFNVKSTKQLTAKLHLTIDELEKCYEGEKNSVSVQKLKGMIREFEEELVWANYGVRVRDVHHLRLGFYKGDMFTEQPQKTRDVKPILDQLKKIKPTVISLALDPEGSGPDTHYKVLQSIAEAVRIWGETTDLSGLRIWGYRNVWYRFDMDEADLIVPVTLNSMAIMHSTFMNCYLSQKEASFPSYDYDGPFSKLSQKIWVEQHRDLQLVLGRDYWYRNPNPHLRAVHGAVYLKEMNVESFLNISRRLEESTEDSIIFKD
tara:strand:- start:8587 stop:10914 length:2328 start_codon:yes stop_codon:yes gene_type:complete